MDPSTDVNQDPLNAKDGGATSYSPDFDMSAINEAVAAGGEADNIQNPFDVNDINLSNTPTTDAELQSQLKDNPDMNLAGADVAGSTAGQPEPQPSVAAATFVSGDLTDEKTPRLLQRCRILHNLTPRPLISNRLMIWRMSQRGRRKRLLLPSRKSRLR